ncbi:tripartite motif-containing protein 3-like isoform X2 [Physella acuta]|uniref:tripartite motif-containing protein 3-like isoform X2 n=1 Tax=Physella acuta TaxID=109671 RepID=UPI0027DB0142|nr:tripartite motif-containing protein 3-like isoform X2 [Physella acuta]
MSTLRNQIREDHLTCAICFNNFIKPKALPCLHTYCENCLRDYVVSRGYESLGHFPCPTCRSQTKMPDSGVDGFPNNHLMSSLSDTVENITPSRPVPKPRRSLGLNEPSKLSGVPEKSFSDVNDEVEYNHYQVDHLDISPPPSYSSVADTHPNISDGATNSIPKTCASDTEPDWMVVSRPSPSGCLKEKPESTEFCMVSAVVTEEMTSPSWSISSNSDENLGSYSNKQHPNQPPAYYPRDNVYPTIPGTQSRHDMLPSVSPPPPIGWNLNVIDGARNPENHDVRTSPHSPDRRPRPNNHPPQIYPAVPGHIEQFSTACTENLFLRFGKQGSTVRDFLKPIGIAVSKEGNYVVSDNAGDQNRIFIFNSGGELITAFKCGCKVKDITMSRKNEILAAVHKNIAAIRHFTMAGQCKGEYGKFFTFEEPCGIAELSNGGVVITGTQNHCVYILTEQMKLATQFGRKGNGDGYFQYPGFVAVDSKDHIIVSDKINHSIQVFGTDGKFKIRFGIKGTSHGNLQTPMGLCVDDVDNIIIADSDNYRVEVFSPKGRWLSTVVKNTHELGEAVKPVNVAVTPTGKVAVLLRGPYFAEVRIYSSNHKQQSDQREGLRKKRR